MYICSKSALGKIFHQDLSTMSIRSMLVTGANRGIGLEFVRQLLTLESPPKHIIASCRNPDAAQDLKSLATTSNSVKIIKLDVSDTSSFESIKEQIKEIVQEDGLHVLLNNAGTLTRQSLDTTTEEALIEHFRINAIGPLMLTKAMRQLLKSANKPSSPSLVVNVTSLMGSISDASSGSYPYRCSKVALNMMSKCLSSDLKEDGILTCLVHPGWVQTDMGGPNAKISVKESVEGMMKVILQMKPEHSGRFWNYNGNELPW